VVSTPLILPSRGTIALWVKPRALTATHGIVGTVGDADGDNRLWITATGAAGGPGVGANRVAVHLGSRLVNDVDIPSPFTADTWTHLALTFDYSAHRYTLYVNGQPMQTSTAVRIQPSHPLDFGGALSNFGQAFFWDGLIDEVLVFDHVLTPQEIATLATVPPPRARARRDLNGDGLDDLVWYNTATGQVAGWFLDHGTVIGGGLIAAVSDTQWQLVGMGDLNADGSPDLVWRHVVTGDVAIWFLQQMHIAATIQHPASPAWHLAAVGDINGDGTDHLVWRERSTGHVAAWLLRGGNIQQGITMTPTSDTHWTLTAVSDITEDGHADLVWRHPGTGDVALWTLTAGVPTGATVLAFGVDPRWHLTAVEDTDADGHADFVWSQEDTGDVAVWRLNRGIFLGAGMLGTTGDPNWQMR